MEKSKKMVKLKKKEHPSWEETFMRTAIEAAKRTRCEWVEVGAVIALMDEGNQQILTTGYNGPPRKVEHCDKVGVGCRRRDAEGNKIPGTYCIGAHAEINAILNAARKGICVENGTLFVTLSPCYECAKHILNSGLKEVVYLRRYSDEFPDKKDEEEQAIALIESVKKVCRPFTGKL